jgi:hypothetical protein
MLPRFGGSSAERIMNCFGSPALCASVPEPNASDHALEGSAAHKLCELGLRDGIDPRDMVGRSVDVKGTKVEVTEDMAVNAEVFIKYVSKYFTRLDGQTDLVIRATLRVEQYVTLTGFHDRAQGTCDAYLYDPDTRTLHVFDFKYGMGVLVTAEKNFQLMFYGLGALLQISEGVDKVVIHVVQPRFDHDDDLPPAPWETTPEELITFGLELVHAIAESQKPNAPLKAGHWCQFCPVAAACKCPALDAVAEEAVAYMATDIQLGEVGDTLDPDETGRRLALLEPLAIWITNTRRFSWNEAQRGRIPTGYKLVPIRGKRKFLDPDLAMRQAAREFKVSEDALFKKKAITPRALEKLVGKKQAAEFLDAHAVKSKGLSLVTLADKREAVLPEMLSEFNDLFATEDTPTDE